MRTSSTPRASCVPRRQDEPLTCSRSGEMDGGQRCPAVFVVGRERHACRLTCEPACERYSAGAGAAGSVARRRLDLLSRHAARAARRRVRRRSRPPLSSSRDPRGSAAVIGNEAPEPAQGGGHVIAEGDRPQDLEGVAGAEPAASRCRKFTKLLRFKLRALLRQLVGIDRVVVRVTNTMFLPLRIFVRSDHRVRRGRRGPLRRVRGLCVLACAVPGAACAAATSSAARRPRRTA